MGGRACKKSRRLLRKRSSDGSHVSFDFVGDRTLQLPGAMNGREIADAMRAKRPNLPVLFVTGYASLLPARSKPMVSQAKVFSQALWVRLDPCA